jgi:uncharacterized RDD family membrane protein YckC
MVIPDWSARRPPFEPTDKPLERSVQLARPSDRLAAVIVDAIILMPMELLLSAPLKRWFTKSYITGFEPDFFMSIVGMTLVTVLAIVLYQALFHTWWGATPGKRLFGLRVEPMFADSQLSFWDYAFRSCVWIFEWLCLGLPLLAIFSNSKRRPLHDRLCDTIVSENFGHRRGLGIDQHRRPS